MKSKLKNVIFDCGGVLVTYHVKDYFQQQGYSDEKAKRLIAATMDSENWKEYDRGVLTDEEIRARFAKDAPDLKEDIDKTLTHMYRLCTKRDTAIPWIEDLKSRGYKTFVLSNFSGTCYHHCSDALDFESHVDGAFWSYQHRVIKPEPAAFLDMLYDFGLKADESVFIDDTRENIEAAERVGLSAVLYTTQEETERALNTLLEE